MIARGQSRTRRSLRIASGCWRFFVAGLFAFYINYIPVHLSSKPHAHDGPAQHLALDADGHHDPEHDGHDAHHVPHPASEHSIQMLLKSGSLLLCLVVFPPNSGIVVEAPDSFVVLPLLERIALPGESPPEPSQPRAPPTA
jgi:hypothetical protein